MPGTAGILVSGREQVSAGPLCFVARHRGGEGLDRASRVDYSGCDSMGPELFARTFRQN